MKQISEKHIGRILAIIVITTLAIVAAISFTSCGVVNNVESCHYWFYDHTKALIVVKKKGHKLYCRSASGIKFYKVKDRYNSIFPGDTIDLRHGQNQWVYPNTVFINKIPERIK